MHVNPNEPTSIGPLIKLEPLAHMRLFCLMDEGGGVRIAAKPDWYRSIISVIQITLKIKGEIASEINDGVNAKPPQFDELRGFFYAYFIV
ncbi:hypothetical protein CAP48_07100 [Advenella sp. S44]|uniref:hypothetical protein n=1 Tax=Advenella sp. S44 TaxID=1982755 RepID=UPI000CA8F194|nr:hypothetical protein [Advenella sp. S44]PJX25796.1 hypothetical protein CAP48_07100 [Advenella sp. S44]